MNRYAVLIASALFALFAFVGTPGLAQAKPATLYVSLTGKDTWSGSLPQPNKTRTDGPFATLNRAQEALRSLPEAVRARGVAVLLRGGVYEMPASLALTAADSGVPGAPVVIGAYSGEHVVLSGGRMVSDWKSYKGAILQANVADLNLGGVEMPSEFHGGGQVPGCELFFGGKRMDLARWPNRNPADIHQGDWAYMAGVPVAGSKTQFTYDDAGHPLQFAHPEEAEVHMFPDWDWSDEYDDVASIDTAKHLITLATPTHYEILPGRRFFIRNIFEELDAPGEWYLDKRSGTLYFYPPSPISANAKVVASVLPFVITMDGAHDVTIKGLTLEDAAGTLIRCQSGLRDRIAACTLLNSEADAITVDGSDCAVVGCDIHDTGMRGIEVSGGDRDTLTASGNVVDDNNIYRFGRLIECYEPAIDVKGVGNRITHNLLHDGPHAAILLGGNDNDIAYNEIHHVCLDSRDCGAIYMGRNWSYRGNVIEYNKIHDVIGYGYVSCDPAARQVVYQSPNDAQAIYLDDAISGFKVYGNIVYRVGRLGVELGGGRDNDISNNIFVDFGDRSIATDARLMSRGLDTMQKTLAGIPYQSPPWSTRYPKLAAPMQHDTWPEDNSITRNIIALTQPHPDAPMATYRLPQDSSLVDDNLYWNGGGSVDLQAGLIGITPRAVHESLADWQKTGFDVHSLNANPQFVDPTHDDYDLKPDSPAFALGFIKIPSEKIGLYSSPDRASWPVAPSQDPGSMAPVVSRYPLGS